MNDVELHKQTLIHCFNLIYNFFFFCRCQNIAYGRNDCTLDVYLNEERSPEERKPVIIFVYGGGWSSGDKSSYGLLCSNIVKCTNSVAVCPNYSTYPKVIVPKSMPVYFSITVISLKFIFHLTFQDFIYIINLLVCLFLISSNKFYSRITVI